MYGYDYLTLAAYNGIPEPHWLDPGEWVVVQDQSKTGWSLLEGIGFLDTAWRVPPEHHEAY
ncbi:MAG TPA: hypothetical protein QGG37_06755 [Chloroflexota bacterium]|nr:hypothetical protein [Chloroflexota bacterium]